MWKTLKEVTLNVLVKNWYKYTNRAWTIENLGALFLVYDNTGLRTLHACSQFCARELPVHATCMQIWYATVYVIMYFTLIFSYCCIILPYTTLKYVILVNIINNEKLRLFFFFNHWSGKGRVKPIQHFIQHVGWNLGWMLDKCWMNVGC